MASFQILDLDSGRPIVEHDAESSRDMPRLYATGVEAAEAAATLNTLNPGKKYQPRPFIIDDSAWRERERERFASGYYTLPVWYAESWWLDSMQQDHFCHISRVDGTRLAYTASAEKGALDRQTPVRPGAYLKQFFANVLSDTTIQQWAIKHETRTGLTALKFATSPEDIDRVYRTGPSSCMNNETGYPHILNRDVFPLHPCHIYAAGDLAVAYTMRDTSRLKRVSGRCVVWPEKKLYGRIYGDRLSDLLHSAGYVAANAWNLDGARLLKVKNAHFGSYTMPYIDGACSVGESDCGNFFIIGRAGHSCSNTSGTTRSQDESAYQEQYGEGDEEDDRPICEHCQESFDGEGVYIRDREESWCDYCADHDAVECEGSGDRLADDYVTLSDGTIWSQRYYDRHGAACDDCNESFASDDVRETGSDGAMRCDDCAAEHSAEAAAEAAGEHVTPTVPHPNQIIAPVDSPDDLWQVGIYAQGIPVFIGFAAFDGVARESGTRAEADALAAKLGERQAYYRFVVQRFQFQQTIAA